MSSQPQWEDVKPPFATIYFLTTISWLIVNFFKKLDTTGYITFGTMSGGALLSAYYIYLGKNTDNQLQQGTVVFYILTWLGINIFSNRQTIVFGVDIEQWRYIILLPAAFIWFLPYNTDQFFGLQEVSEYNYMKSLWKLSIVFMLVINSLKLPVYAELLILVPLILEPITVYKSQKDQLPLLTLHIHRELQDKFSVPLSLLKGILVIMGSFIFEIINSRLWLLIILVYFAASFVWFLDFIIPEGIKSNSNEEEIGEFFKGMTQEFNDKPVVKNIKSNSIKLNQPTQYSDNTYENEKKDSIEINEIKGELIEVQNQAKISNDITNRDKATDIGKKAHALGSKVRTELQKPQYNLNHILSTLSKEDFTSAFRVPKDGLEFDSKDGKWSPPKNLILFPIELSKYDYRRVDEILLLGFNKPISTSNTSINIQFGEKSKYNTKISDNQIQIGDTTFNMKTLVLYQNQWDQTKCKLEIIEDVDDISYTGFKTLSELQEKLGKISEKWIQLRKQAEDAVVNFLAGLLGSTEPIFLGASDVEGIITETNISTNDYEIEPDDGN